MYAVHNYWATSVHKVLHMRNAIVLVCLMRGRSRPQVAFCVLEIIVISI